MKQQPANPTEKEVRTTIFVVECPHCHTELDEGIHEQIITLRCPFCNNPIKLLWDIAPTYF